MIYDRGKYILLAFAEAKKHISEAPEKLIKWYLNPLFRGPSNCGNCFQKLAINIWILRITGQNQRNYLTIKPEQLFSYLNIFAKNSILDVWLGSE